MTAPKRILLSRAAGWRMPPNAVKVDRSTVWGNPWRIGEPIDMKQAKRWGWSISPAGRTFVCPCATVAVARFRHCLLWDEAIHDHVRSNLAGKDLACWCALDAPCHADVLLWLANSASDEIRALHRQADAEIMAHATAVAASSIEKPAEE